MTDDLATHLLVTHLRSIDHMSFEDCFLQSPYFIKAADRLVALAAERDEAINQLDSSRHSVEVLERRVAEVIADNDRLREIGTEMAKSIEGNYYLPGVAARWRAALKGESQ